MEKKIIEEGRCFPFLEKTYLGHNNQVKSLKEWRTEGQVQGKNCLEHFPWSRTKVPHGLLILCNYVFAWTWTSRHSPKEHCNWCDPSLSVPSFNRSQNPYDSLSWSQSIHTATNFILTVIENEYRFFPKLTWTQLTYDDRNKNNSCQEG